MFNVMESTKVLITLSRLKEMDQSGLHVVEVIMTDITL